MRLAERVFAPHYAAPMPRVIAHSIALRAAPAADSETLAELKAGEPFEVLELAGNNAWGVAPGAGLVGYILANSLAAQTL